MNKWNKKIDTRNGQSWSTYILYIGGFDIIVTDHTDYGGKIVMQCNALGVYIHYLNTTDIEEAAKIAIQKVKRRLYDMMQAVEEFEKEGKECGAGWCTGRE